MVEGGGPQGWWDHQIREQLRKKHARIAEKRREGTQGLVNADKEAVAHVLRPKPRKKKKKTDDGQDGGNQDDQPADEEQEDAEEEQSNDYKWLRGVQRGIAHAVLGASTMVQKHLHAAGLVDDARCPFCGTDATEVLPHMLWDCEAWRELRKKIMGREKVNTEGWTELKKHTTIPEMTSDDRAAEEISQLLYHAQVLMLASGLTLDDVYAHL